MDTGKLNSNGKRHNYYEKSIYRRLKNNLLSENKPAISHGTNTTALFTLKGVKKD